LKAGLRLAAERGLPANQIILAGQSAGAAIASLMLLDRVSLHKNDFQQENFCGLLLISGMLDFWYCQNKKGISMLKNYLGKPNRWPLGDPVRYIQGDERVPVLCLHGDEDLLVDKSNSISFVHKLNEKGPQVAELSLVKDWHHTDLAMMFLEPLPATERMLDWLEERAEAMGSDQ
jgi:acetyl esterase/lipase